MRFRQLLPLFGALFALYIIWGSTYFVIRIGVESLKRGELFDTDLHFI